MKRQNDSVRSPKSPLGKWLVNGLLVVVVLFWTIPTFGVLVTSFRDSRDIYASGWWTILPHMEWVKTGEIRIADDIDTNGAITIEGRGASFAEWREGIENS